MKVSIKTYIRSPISVGVEDRDYKYALWCYTTVNEANPDLVCFKDIHEREWVKEEIERYYRCKAFNSRRL
jgi:hypothetical protein